MTNQFSIQQVKIYILTFGGRSKFFFWFIGMIKQNDTNQPSIQQVYDPNSNDSVCDDLLPCDSFDRES